MVCVRTSSLSLLVIGVFEALPRLRALCSVLARHRYGGLSFKVRHPAALARDYCSVLTRDRYRGLSLTS